MKRIYVKEEWCLGCHLCEYNCAFANSGMTDMVKALRGKTIYPRIQVEQDENGVTYAVSCRHCKDPICVKSCIAGALSMAFGCTLMAPHGGIFVFAVVGNWPMYLVALVVGMVVGAVMLRILKKKVTKEEEQIAEEVAAEA